MTETRWESETPPPEEQAAFVLGSASALYSVIIILLASRVVAHPKVLDQNTVEMYLSFYRNSMESVSLGGGKQVAPTIAVYPMSIASALGKSRSGN